MSETKYSNVNDNTPVLVGCAQLTDKKGINGYNYLEILTEVSKLAIEDCKSSLNLNEHLDTVAVIRFVADTPHRDSATSNLWGYPNMPRSLANSLNFSASNELYTTTGGNSPQIVLNEVANRIKDKQIECALLAGGEALDTFVSRLKQGLEVNWEDDPGGEPELLGKSTDGTNDHEKLHGIFDPSSVYPLFANALRGINNQTIQEHMQDTGELFETFSKVASENKYSWFPIHRSAEEIAKVEPQNRMIGLPYTKYMNSIMRVNQS
jgi:acetyl-CoA C-acetyltransferase